MLLFKAMALEQEQGEVVVAVAELGQESDTTTAIIINIRITIVGVHFATPHLGTVKSLRGV